MRTGPSSSPSTVGMEVTYVGSFGGTTIQGTCVLDRLGEGSFEGR